MRDHPILFSGSMIRAILAGTKTQTRRVMKPQPDSDAIITVGEIGTSRGAAYIRYPMEGGHTLRVPCPYGEPESSLWVRETCRADELASGLDGVRYLADDAFREIENTEDASDKWMDLRWYGNRASPVAPVKTVPAIHMPRWASRITLEITGIRVERLQVISEADAKSEGCGQVGVDTGMVSVSSAPIEIGSYIAAYCDLWESINGPGSWDANPWVWVVEFRRVDK